MKIIAVALIAMTGVKERSNKAIKIKDLVGTITDMVRVTAFSTKKKLPSLFRRWRFPDEPRQTLRFIGKPNKSARE